MRMLPLLLSLVLLAAAPGDPTLYLVKDINPEYVPASSDPQSFRALGDIALFRVRGELWRSDGTASGTYRLAETLDECSASTGKLCFFNAFSRLWVTDGTLPGTFALAETRISGSPAWVAAHGVLYFAASDPDEEHGEELWRSDGTPGGTYEVLDIEPGTGSSNPRYLTSFQGQLYFTASSRLWRSDGTAQGTVLVRDVPAASLHVVDSRLVFLGRDAGHGQELWASDGTTEGTRRISDLVKGEDSPEFWGSFVVSGKLLYFVASVGLSYEINLYATDGTDQGTRKLTSFSRAWPFSYRSDPIAAPGDRLFFAVDDGAHGMELWSSNGTPEGTRLVLDACPGDCPSDPGWLALHEGRIYYPATDGMHGSELWVTDGTAQGTRMVKDLCPGTCGNGASILSSLGRRLLFTAGGTLWATDGTEGGTAPLGAAGLAAGTAAGGMLFFAGTDPDHGCEPWISDGTPQGTHLVADLAQEDVGGSNPGGLMRLGKSALFSARDREGPALWKSDGTEAGTVVVKRGLPPLRYLAGSASRVFFKLDGLWTSDGSETGTLRLTPEGVDVSGTWQMAQAGSRFLFFAHTAEHGAEPWITDGTRAGTRRLADLKPGPGSSGPVCFTAFRGKAWFGALGRLWKSDGKSAAVVRSFPDRKLVVCPFMTFGGRLLFTVDDAHSTAIWSTDGTSAGTEYLAGARYYGPGFVAYRGRLWFTGRDELWSTDGTYAGTRFETYLPGDEAPDLMMSDGARLYLCVSDPWDDNTGLWVSDGTEEGTQEIYDDLTECGPWALLGGRLHLAASPDGTLYRTDGTSAGTRPVLQDGKLDRVSDLLVFGNRLLAFTRDGEVWQTDGTSGGTKLLRDLSPASYHSWQFAKIGPRLLFPGWEEETGWELWALQE